MGATESVLNDRSPPWSVHGQTTKSRNVRNVTMSAPGSHPLRGRTNIAAFRDVNRLHIANGRRSQDDRDSEAFQSASPYGPLEFKHQKHGVSSEPVTKEFDQEIQRISNLVNVLESLEKNLPTCEPPCPPSENREAVVPGVLLSFNRTIPAEEVLPKKSVRFELGGCRMASRQATSATFSLEQGEVARVEPVLHVRGHRAKLDGQIEVSRVPTQTENLQKTVVARVPSPLPQKYSRESRPRRGAGRWCEHCNIRLLELKRQAVRILIPIQKLRHLYAHKAQDLCQLVQLSPRQDPDLVGRIQDRLFIPDNCRRALVSDRCQVCETHVGQLKQEVVSMVQSFERAQSQDAASSAPGGSSTSASAPAPVARTAKVPTVLRLPSSGTPSGHHRLARQSRAHHSSNGNNSPSPVAAQAQAYLEQNVLLWMNPAKQNQMYPGPQGAPTQAGNMAMATDMSNRDGTGRFPVGQVAPHYSPQYTPALQYGPAPQYGFTSPQYGTTAPQFNGASPQYSTTAAPHYMGSPQQVRSPVSQYSPQYPLQQTPYHLQHPMTGQSAAASFFARLVFLCAHVVFCSGSVFVFLIFLYLKGH
ncbi:uncharacterized protein LOC106158835 [Lingula anatina]|uniref:Uncharacterized protein LOC106158835 n=1 Tax=Lingula anatina TaxID=7574 RepID=A0A1S3HXV3_LINAN|nr:uncharacterized protein LOC106158835 [Lingula anatina]|eukprot:XP_013390391.1 uncharacterized protein LOC106158835 [Lingula anatina]